MTYQEALDYLNETLPNFQRIGPAAFKNNLDNSLALMQFLEQPQAQYPTIHIAGTNGKGSTAHLLSAVLQAAGYKVGLYSSPHYIDFREQIKINGQYIREQAVIDFTQRIPDFVRQYQPSFFELATGMAFDYFRTEKVDIAIIETGLGGRLDSTNILSPILSIITNIGFDHQQILGDSLTKIAFEKAGIIKANTPVVIGEDLPETRSVFLEKALACKAPIYFANEHIRIEVVKQDIEAWLVHVWEKNQKVFDQLSCSLSGDYQLANIKTALAALSILRHPTIKISPAHIYQGFKAVKQLTNIIGRWEILQATAPTIICDSAHNADGMAYVGTALMNIPHQNLHIVFGMVNDKSPEQLLSLLPKAATYYFCKANIPRGLAALKLLEIALKLGLKGRAYPTVPAAFAAAKANAHTNDLIFVGGSIYTLAEIL